MGTAGGREGKPLDHNAGLSTCERREEMGGASDHSMDLRKSWLRQRAAPEQRQPLRRSLALGKDDPALLPHYPQ